MGRRSNLSEAQVFKAVSLTLNRQGSVTFKDLVQETGVSIGSLYHRFDSREGLMAATWLDALQGFHQEFLGALQSKDPNPGLKAALATPEFCRQQPERAALLACCRGSEFLSSKAPEDVIWQIKQSNQRVESAVSQYAETRQLPLQACLMGLVTIPLGAVRLYLPDIPVPASVDAYVEAAFHGVMEAAGRYRDA